MRSQPFPEELRLDPVKRVNNFRIRFQYFVFHVQLFFFSIYIYSHIESVDIVHSWQIRKNWFQNRNRSLCELCIQGAICEEYTCVSCYATDLFVMYFLLFPFTFLCVVKFLSLFFRFLFALFVPCLLFFLSFFPFFFLVWFLFLIWTMVHLIGCNRAARHR